MKEKLSIAEVKDKMQPLVEKAPNKRGEMHWLLSFSYLLSSVLSSAYPMANSNQEVAGKFISLVFSVTYFGSIEVVLLIILSLEV